MGKYDNMNMGETPRVLQHLDDRISDLERERPAEHRRVIIRQGTWDTMIAHVREAEASYAKMGMWTKAQHLNNAADTLESIKDGTYKLYY